MTKLAPPDPLAVGIVDTPQRLLATRVESGVDMLRGDKTIDEFK